MPDAFEKILLYSNTSSSFHNYLTLSNVRGKRAMKLH
jgi:hypothetical protein